MRIVNQGKSNVELAALDVARQAWYTQILLECQRCEHSFYLDEIDLANPHVANDGTKFVVAQARTPNGPRQIVGLCPNCGAKVTWGCSGAYAKSYFKEY